MRKFYRIKGLGPGLDGLVAEGELTTVKDSGTNWERTYEFLEVVALHNPDRVAGDRIITNPLAAGMLLHPDVLEECGDPRLRQFDTRNPWGRCLFEGHYKQGKLSIAYAQYEQALQVTVSESLGTASKPVSKTLYTEYFLRDHSEVRARIEGCLAAGKEDDLIFLLREVKRANKEPESMWTTGTASLPTGDDNS